MSQRCVPQPFTVHETGSTPDTLAEPKARSRKRTYAFLFRSMRTLRFLILARAGRVTRIDGRNVLRLANNPATQALYERIAHALAA
jgi:hypothetical protein